MYQFGKWQDGNSVRMIYARTELVGNTQYYFYKQRNGSWDFTWDEHLPNLDPIDLDFDPTDLDDFEAMKLSNKLCKFYKQFSEYL